MTTTTSSDSGPSAGTNAGTSSSHTKPWPKDREPDVERAAVTTSNSAAPSPADNAATTCERETEKPGTSLQLIPRPPLPAHHPAWEWVGNEAMTPADIGRLHVRRAYQFDDETRPRCADLVEQQRVVRALEADKRRVEAEARAAKEAAKEAATAVDTSAAKSSESAAGPKPGAGVPKKNATAATTNKASLAKVSAASTALDRARKQLQTAKSTCQRKCVGIDGKPGNPFCLNLLGQELWQDEDEAFARFASARGALEGTFHEARAIPGLPIGLRNLGATCYMNAYMQMWFFDRAFLTGVYRFPVDPTKTSPIYHLQLLCAYLQYGNRRVYNPKALVESMSLKESEQQDANEFYRLFVSMLEKACINSSSPALPNFIHDLHGGVYAHTTQCKRCKTKSTRPELFSQVELNIRDRITLDECLRDYLHEDVLSGDNQYQCPRCQSKQDAGRFAEFQRFPVVLNFQLLRFLIDFTSENFTKKKTKALVKFPRSIDMNQYLSPEQRVPDRPLIYDLKAVLLHRGESAYSGHYMAHVYDEKRQAWFKCNDEVVKPLAGFKKIHMYDVSPDDDYEFIPATNEDVGEWQQQHSASSSSKAPPSKTVSDSADEEHSNNTPSTDLYQSRNAYMLTYVLREHAQQTADLDPQPPSQIMEQVALMNKEFEDQVTRHREEQEAIRKEFNEERVKRLQLLTCWRPHDIIGSGNHGDIDDDIDIMSESKPDVLVPAVWLHEWFHRPFCASIGGGVPLATIDMTSALCKHGKLDLTFSNAVKIISDKAYALLRGYGFLFKPEPVLGSDDLCGECVEDVFRGKLSTVQRTHQIDHVVSLVRTADSARASKLKGKSVLSANTSSSSSVADMLHAGKKQKLTPGPSAETNPAVWISSDWYREWCKKSPQFIISTGDKEDDVFGSFVLPMEGAYTADTVCEHGGLQPEESSRRLIPAAAWSALCDYLPGLKAALQRTNAHIFSEKDKPCGMCSRDLQYDMAEASESKAMAKQERAAFRALLTEDRSIQVMFAQIRTAQSRRDQIALVSAAFLDAWRMWLGNPTTAERPVGVDNSDLICAHMKVSVDVNEPRASGGYLSTRRALWWWEKDDNGSNLDESKYLYMHAAIPQHDSGRKHQRYRFVTKMEYDLLLKYYPESVGPEIDVQARTLILRDDEAGGSLSEHTLAVATYKPELGRDALATDSWLREALPCPECIAKEKRDWAEAAIFVRRVSGSYEEALAASVAKGAASRPRAVQIDESAGNIDESLLKPLPRRSGRAVTAAPVILDMSSESDTDDSEPAKNRPDVITTDSAKTQSTLSGFVQSNSTSTEAPATIIENSRRGSRRTRNGKSLNKFTVNHWTTVKELKLLVMHATNLSPVQQRLFVCGRALDDNESRLGDLDVFPGMIVELVAHDEEESDIVDDSRQALELEMGFAGTVLLGGSSVAASADGRNSAEMTTGNSAGNEMESFEVVHRPAEAGGETGSPTIMSFADDDAYKDTVADTGKGTNDDGGKCINDDGNTNVDDQLQNVDTEPIYGSPPPAIVLSDEDGTIDVPSEEEGKAARTHIRSKRHARRSFVVTTTTKPDADDDLSMTVIEESELEEDDATRPRKKRARSKQATLTGETLTEDAIAEKVTGGTRRMARVKKGPATSTKEARNSTRSRNTIGQYFQAKPRTRKEIAKEQWACAACSFLNRATLKACEMCNTPMGESVVARNV